MIFFTLGMWTSDWSESVATHCPSVEVNQATNDRHLRQLKEQRAKAFNMLAAARCGEMDVDGLLLLASTLTNLASRVRRRPGAHQRLLPPPTHPTAPCSFPGGDFNPKPLFVLNY